MSQDLVVGSITGLFTREMYHFISNRGTWNGKSSIPDDVRMELRFREKNLEALNFKYLEEGLIPARAGASVNSDASSVASGAVLNIGEKSYTAHKNLSGKEKSRSSTWRELDAVHFAIQAIREKLKGLSVRWETDNQAVPIIIRKGSNKKHLQKLAKEIYYLTRNNNIDLEINWIPREQNTVADEVSKFIDYDDRTTTDSFFRELSQTWGKYSIGKFANHKNALFWNPKCEAVDVFFPKLERRSKLGCSSSMPGNRSSVTRKSL